MSIDAALPENHPIRVAWDAYKATPEFANALRWATRQEHAEGSLWAAFVEGFSRANSTPEGKPQ